MTKGDPEKDKQFIERLVAIKTEVENFLVWCNDKHETGKDIVHNLDQRTSREGVKLITHMTADIQHLLAELFVRNDICNEQGRSGLSSAIKKLRSNLAGR